MEGWKNMFYYQNIGSWNIPAPPIMAIFYELLQHRKALQKAHLGHEGSDPNDAVDGTMNQ